MESYKLSGGLTGKYKAEAEQCDAEIDDDDDIEDDGGDGVGFDVDGDDDGFDDDGGGELQRQIAPEETENDAEEIPNESMHGGEDREDSKPVYIYFDVETTGLSIYQDHIVEVAAVVQSELSSHVKSPDFQTLVQTSRKINSKGNSINVFDK